MAQSKITIGITCFNAEDTIERAVASAQAQEWDKFEILIVDDRSADGSVEKIQDMVAADKRIRFIRHEQNKGFPAALNTIIENATSEFIAFFDDDDESAPARLQKQYERLTNYERKTSTQFVFCYSNRAVVKPGAEKQSATVYAIGRAEKPPHGAIVADFLLWHREKPGYSWGQFGSCTLMVRRQVLQNIGGFDERFRRCAEWDMAIRSSFEGAHFIAVSEPLVTQYITPTGDKAGLTPLKYAKMLREKNKDYLKGKHIYRASKAIAYSRFHYANGRKGKSRLFLMLACLLSPHAVLSNELAKRLRNVHS